MKRILPAAGFAMAIHAFLLTLEVRPHAPVRVLKSPKVVQLSLTSISPAKGTGNTTKQQLFKKKPEPVAEVKKVVPKKLKRRTSSIKKSPKRNNPPKGLVKQPKTLHPRAKKASASQTAGESKPETRPSNTPTAPISAPAPASSPSTTGSTVPIRVRTANIASIDSVGPIGRNEKSTQLEIQKAFPEYQKNPPPRYPPIARRKGHEGIVLIDVLVDRNGLVRELKIAQSSGHRILDRAALKSVKKWVFVPGKKRDQTIDMWVSVPIRFALQ